MSPREFSLCIQVSFGGFIQIFRRASLTFLCPQGKNVTYWVAKWTLKFPSKYTLVGALMYSSPCISFPKEMDATQLCVHLGWVTKRRKTMQICSRPKWAQAIQSERKGWPNKVASRPKRVIVFSVSFHDSMECYIIATIFCFFIIANQKMKA